MMFSRLTKFAFAAALALPAVAGAQTNPEILKFEGVKTPGGATVGSAQTGAYRASRSPFSTPITTFDIYCIDLDHTALATWTAHYITFQEAVGIYAVEAQRQLGTEKTWGVAELRAAAYLSTQFTANVQSDWDDVHGSIWSMFSNNANAAAHNGMVANALTVAGSDANWDSYVLVLDDKVFSPNWTNGTVINQGFITEGSNTTIRVITPEPSTYVLMGAGLLAVGFVRRRRRSA